MDGWTQHLRLFAGTLAALLATAVTLVWLANPYGNLRVSPSAHVLMDDNQRFQYPAVIRSRRYDSLVIGTSTARLLEPAQLGRVFGGRFANLALNSGTAWEQWRIARLFADEVTSPRTLLVGLDHVWCEADADTRRITPRGFPEWMFDNNPWNDPAYMLNTRTLEISGRRVGHMLGLVKERWPHNGYEVFVPPESQYDLARARRHIWGAAGQPALPIAWEDVQGTPQMQSRVHALQRPAEFPAHAWLEDLLVARRFERIVLLITPVHVAGMQGSLEWGARSLACKQSLAAIAARHDNRVIDFRIASPITREDSHYWDALHFRVPIAARVVDGLARAVATGADDPGGDWRILRGEPR